MEFYIALVLALGLACVAGVQYYYLMFLETRARQQRRRISELERVNLDLLEELRNEKGRLQEELQRSVELWPDMIDEDSVTR